MTPAVTKATIATAVPMMILRRIRNTRSNSTTLTWEDERAYFSGVTHGSGQVQTDTDGEVIVLYMPERYVFNGFVRKEWKSGRYNQFVQLNVDNILNDTDLYGQIYAPGITARLSYQIGF